MTSEISTAVSFAPADVFDAPRKDWMDLCLRWKDTNGKKRGGFEQQNRRISSWIVVDIVVDNGTPKLIK